MIKREFAKAGLDENSETFVVHVAALEAETSIYLSQKTQTTALQWDKASTEVPAKYFDYADAFSFYLAMELPENIGINELLLHYHHWYREGIDQTNKGLRKL